MSTGSTVREREYTLLCPFGGLGAGALGFLQARVDELVGASGRFRCIGGIDSDNEACKDFVYLTGAPSLCADIAAMTPEQLRSFAGDTAPDVVFLSPPCKGSSSLLSAAKAKSPKYQALNGLALAWIRLMLRTWPTPPRLVLLENVPRITTRAAGMLRKVRSMLHDAGYLSTGTSHDCGELGGLAQHRKRFLLVARHQASVPPILYQPIRQKVRACGSVLELLPMPGDPAAGPMHRLPKLSWLNWVRLALIPAGGDWRDLPGVLDKDEERRAKFKRHAVEAWEEPTGTIGGSGSNGVANVADPRIVGLSDNPTRHRNKYAVQAWEAPAKTVMGATRPGSGGPSVADPRPLGFPGFLGVKGWDEPSGVVAGSSRATNGSFSVADPRVPGFKGRMGVTAWEDPVGVVAGESLPSNGSLSVADPRLKMKPCFAHCLRVVPWDQPVGTITHAPSPSNGAAAVADPRVKNAFDHGYAVLPWTGPSHTVAGGSAVGQGAYSVADPRLDCEPRAGVMGVIPWSEAAKTVTGTARVDNGCFAVADPRIPDVPVMVISDVKKAPPHAPVILAEDGTWHRPLTTLELAALQSLPTMVNGKPLQLAGTSSSRHRERIGNAVPCSTAKAIAERMLMNLMGADLQAWALSIDGEVWVRQPNQEARA